METLLASAYLVARTTVKYMSILTIIAFLLIPTPLTSATLALSFLLWTGVAGVAYWLLASAATDKGIKNRNRR